MHACARASVRVGTGIRADGTANLRHKVPVGVDRVVGPRLEGGILGRAVGCGEGQRQDWDLDQREPSMGAGAGAGTGLQPSLRLLAHDRTWQGWASGSGKPGLESAGRPNTAGRLPPCIETPKITPRSSRKSDDQPWRGVTSVF